MSATAGVFAGAAAKLQRMVANSATFQAAIGAASMAAALDQVLLKDATDEQQKPFAVISLLDSFGYELTHPPIMRPNGGLNLYLEIDTPPEFYEDAIQAQLYAGTFFGGVIDDLAAMSDSEDEGQDEDFLILQSIKVVEFCETPEEYWKSVGRFYWMNMSVIWGDGSGS